ncbi:MAG: IPT/TIG domain-containing protein, partial [Chloroflexi bacterium]|nr:IPT/TIG domain-containing protein [Chloroflexota bacterium]
TTPTAQPTITRLTPSSGPIGTSVTITGTGFSTTANTIKFSSYSFFDVPSSNNGTTLTFTVPSQIWNNCRSTDYMCFQTQPAARTTIPGTYNVTVTNTNGTSNEVEFTVTQNVTIQPVSPTPISLLYNPGPSYIAGKTIVNDTSKTAVTAPWVSIGTSLAQAFLVGNPSGLCPQGLQGINVEGASNTPASNGACESYYNDTRFWWKSSEWKQWPGWDVHVAGNGNGTPLELFYANHAYPLSQCTQQSREVGIAFDGSSSIKPNMNLGQFKTVTGTFDLNISAQSINPTINCPNGYEAPFQNVTDPWAYVSGDFRVNYFNPDGTWVRGDIFSVHVYNAQAVANKDIFWQGSTCTVNPSNNQYGCTVMINPSAADVSSSAISPGGGYKTFSINFKELYKKYVTPPPGFTTDDAVVGGYDVYSSVRGVDMNFSLKNINLVGTK